MANIDPTEALNFVKASLGIAAYTATTTPVNGRLMTTVPTSGTNGTEVVNGGGSTYAAVSLTGVGWSSASLPVTNAGAATWTNLPTVGSPGIQGLEIWDSNATPKRKWYGALAAAKITALGDSLSIATGQLSITAA